MTFKTLLVHLDASERRAARLEVAFDLAERFDAHVVGLFALERLYIPPYVGSGHRQVPRAHGATVSVAEESSRGEEIGQLIRQRARELVLGGATRTVLRSMHVPVLMSR